MPFVADMLLRANPGSCDVIRPCSRTELMGLVRLTSAPAAKGGPSMPSPTRKGASIHSTG
jgi:hypothetical protein